MESCRHSVDVKHKSNRNGWNFLFAGHDYTWSQIWLTLVPIKPACSACFFVDNSFRKMKETSISSPVFKCTSVTGKRDYRGKQDIKKAFNHAKSLPCAEQIQIVCTRMNKKFHQFKRLWPLKRKVSRPATLIGKWSCVVIPDQSFGNPMSVPSPQKGATQPSIK